MMKLNNKGYMLVEIILAFSITFALVYFVMDLVIDLKNKNDDLVVEAAVKTDQTIITNRLMEYVIDGTSDPDNIDFACERIKVENNTVIYDSNGDNNFDTNDDVIMIVDDHATISYVSGNNCSIDKGKVSIRIPVKVKQMPDKDYDIDIDYRYEYK